MNAHVIRIQGSAWRPRKGGSVKLVIEVRPETQAQWVKALEMFKQRPELSVTVVAPKVDPLPKWKTHRGVERHRYEPPVYSAGEYEPNEGEVMKETVAAIKGKIPTPDTNPDHYTTTNAAGYDASGMPKADVDCPVPGCDLLFEHEGDHSAVAIVATPLLDCPLPDCNLLAGHKGKCVKKKVKA